MSEKQMVIRCLNCGTKNRIPKERLHDQPLCGKCGATLDEIRHYLDLYGDHGEGRVQQMRFVLERTDATIRELELKRAHIDASLAELRVINAEVRKQLERRTA